MGWPGYRVVFTRLAMSPIALLLVRPKFAAAVTQTITISDSITAYSTAFGPSSLLAIRLKMEVNSLISDTCT